MAALGSPIYQKEQMLLADKGYDAARYEPPFANKNGWANIPPKTNRKGSICFSPYL
jgi:hypothetical protein